MSRNQQANILQPLMSESQIEESIEKMSEFILGEFLDLEQVILLGVATRGVPLSEKIAESLEKKTGKKVRKGQIDATFYRDDFHFRNRFKNPSMKVSLLKESLDEKQVVLVDDVMFTGRSARAAINAIMDLGRPSSVKFITLIDRGQRELPIQPDFTGLCIDGKNGQEVRVFLKPIDSKNGVELVQLEEENG